MTCPSRDTATTLENARNLTGFGLKLQHFSTLLARCLAMSMPSKAVHSGFYPPISLPLQPCR